MKKFFILFNVILIAVFVLGITRLYIKTGSGKIATHNFESYNFIKISRPSVDVSGSYAALFDVKPIERNGKDRDKNKASGLNHADGLNQLITAHEIFRVMGIFITEDRQIAAIMIIPKGKGKRNAGKIQKVVAGDMIKDYSVVYILPESIVLSHPSSANITLKIFKSATD